METPTAVSKLGLLFGGGSSNGEVGQGLDQLWFPKPDVSTSAMSRRLPNLIASSIPSREVNLIVVRTMGIQAVADSANGQLYTGD